MADDLRESSSAAMRRASVKQRAADARASAAATKAWLTHVTAAAAGTLWRVSSAWVEQCDGTHCAELTHVSTGKTRVIKLAAADAMSGCRTQIVGENA